MKAAFFAIIFTLINSIAFSQTSPEQLKKYAENLDTIYQLNPLEKAYAQIDKNWYFPGETVWFKSYITVDNQLSTLSKVLYVDIVNEQDSVVVKTMWKIKQNTSNGNIYLPESLTAGNYKLRAYTMWMLNTPNVVDEKIIRIVAPMVNNEAEKSNLLQQQYSVGFYPESGYLLAGVASKLAFKIENANHLPITGGKVEITDSKGKIVANAMPFKDGMGSFTFSPESNEKYTAFYTLNGAKYACTFPEVKTQGVQLEITAQNSARVFFNIKRTDSVTDVMKEMVMIVHMNGIPYYVDKLSLQDDTQIGGAILKKNMPNGILSITIFSKNMTPLAERLVYINKYTQVPIALETIEKSMLAKGLHKYQISLPNDSANISVAVVANDSISNSYTNHNIVSYLLLGSEVKGYVHNPYSYFISQDSSTVTALDLLMLTQGWRRFDWNNILQKKLPDVNYFIETGISVSGIVKAEKRKYSFVNDGKIDLIIKTEDSTTVYATAELGADGKYFFNNLDFRKSAKLFTQGVENNKKTSSAFTEMYPSYIDALNKALFEKTGIKNYDTTSKLPTAIVKLMDAYYDADTMRRGNILGNVTVRTKTKSLEQKVTDEYAAEQYRNSEYTYVLDSLTGFASVWQFVQGQVPGLVVSGDLFTNPIVNFNRYSGSTTDPANVSQTMWEEMNNGSSSIAFYLNEIPVPMQAITDLSPKDIALIKVNRMGSAVTNAPAGSMFVYTRKSYNSNKGFQKATITGYNTATQYYHPLYNTETSKVRPDKRSSIYWNEKVKFANKQATISFYNNDIATKLKIIIEGLDKNGYPIYLEKIIE